jgi:predicted oxidoreductase
MVSFMIANEELIEEVLNKRLPKDRNTYEWYVIAQEILNRAYNIKSKAQDELMVTLLVAAFDKEQVDMDIVISTDEAIKFFKDHGKHLQMKDSLEELITEANKIQGVYVIKFDDFDKEIALARTFGEDSLEICVCADIEELNKKINENFNSIEDAANTINTKEGRFSTMSVLLLK